MKTNNKKDNIIETDFKRRYLFNTVNRIINMYTAKRDEHIKTQFNKSLDRLEKLSKGDK